MVLYPRVLTPATEKARPYRIYRRKTESCFWSGYYTRSKIPFLCSGNELQIFKYPPFERTLCIDTYRINFVYQKMELQGNIVYLWKKKIIMILEHVNVTSENRRRKHDVVTTLVFRRSNDVGSTTLWQRCDNVIRCRDQNTTKTQRCYNVMYQLGCN